MDSLLIGIDIPKIYFREISKGSYEFEVVDGQQRLRAVFEYFANEYSLPTETDDIDGHRAHGYKFQQLHTDLQMRLQNTGLDVVVMNHAYTDDDIEEMFLRLQNGTPLNAPEKRRAVQGNMKNVVKELAKNKIFDLCGFTDKRFAYEDAVAKILHILINGRITDLRAASITKTYRDNESIDLKNPSVARLKKAFSFIVKAFKKTPSPKLKKFSIITLTYLVAELIDTYNLQDFGDEFGNAYIAFELERIENEEKDEEDQDPEVSAYTDAARADSIQDLTYRHEFLRKRIIRNLPDLALKDLTRGFSDDQRAAIYWRDKGICKICKKKVAEGDFHADHVKSHTSGGQTKISNGQTTHVICNLKKGKKSVSSK
jgi:hypothetical protein